MNEKLCNSFLRKNVSEERKTQKDACTATDGLLDTVHDGHTSTRSTTYHGTRSGKLSVRKFFQAFKSYIVSSEDDISLQCTSKKGYSDIDKEPVFVLVESNSLSNPSSKEILIDSRNVDREITYKGNLQQRLKQGVIPFDTPSTSKDHGCDVKLTEIKISESKDELQMADINLQSENEIVLDDNDIDKESIVLSYLKNKDAILDREGMILSTKKKSSLLRSVPKMETIVEGEQFYAFSPSKSESALELSETSLDAHIPSFPGSPRSIHYQGSKESILSDTDKGEDWRRAIDFLHRDNDFLVAAETGNDKLLEIFIRKGTNVHQRDFLGRNALHLAVCAESMRAIVLLLKAGINPNIKDNVGMTPLSLCLMRRPSLAVANQLFNYGAKIIPRQAATDTGLFLQFVMMCKPTTEERKILCRLVEKGAQVNDPTAPGGRQAIHFAAMSNNCDLIRLLIDLGADISMKNHRNETPTQVAKTFNCREAYSLLSRIEETFDSDQLAEIKVEESEHDHGIDTDTVRSVNLSEEDIKPTP